MPKDHIMSPRSLGEIEETHQWHNLNLGLQREGPQLDVLPTRSFPFSVNVEKGRLEGRGTLYRHLQKFDEVSMGKGRGSAASTSGWVGTETCTCIGTKGRKGCWQMSG